MLFLAPPTLYAECKSGTNEIYLALLYVVRQSVSLVDKAYIERVGDMVL